MLRSVIIAIFFIALLFVPNTSTFAADIRSNDELTIATTEQNLEDLYLFGGSIRVLAPVTNDLVAAGGNIDVEGDVSGSVILAGGNINLLGNIGNTARVAGGNIRISSDITRDLVIAGGQITVTNDAEIAGDVVVNGGQIRLDGPIQGKIIVNGGEVTINAPVNGNVEGNMGLLQLGPSAVLNGNLTYSATQKATLADGAVVKGKQTFTQRTDKEEAERKVGDFVRTASIYKLLADIILSVLFIAVFQRFIMQIINRMRKEPVKDGAIGLAYFVAVPMVSLLLLVLIWLGLASFLFYALSIIIAVFLVKIFIGWYLLHWYEQRNKREYVLDWKAGVFGPIVLFLLMLIPIIGWLVVAIMFCVALGALLMEASTVLSTQKIERKSVKKTK